MTNKMKLLVCLFQSGQIRLCYASGGSVVKNLSVTQEMQEAWVRSLAGEDPLKEEVATHSSALAWKIPWTEETGGLQSIGLQRSGQD